jgi:hypothetical protein
MFGTGVTLSVDQIWMILVFFAFLFGHISGVVMTIRLGRHREHNIQVD